MARAPRPRPPRSTRLGQRGPAGPLALTGEAGLLGRGLRGGDGGLALRVGVGDRGVLARLGLLLDLVPLGVGRLAHLGVELALLELGVALGDLLLLGQDELLALGLGQRPAAADWALAASISAWIAGLLEGQVAVGLGDGLLGQQPLLLGLLAGHAPRRSRRP